MIELRLREERFVFDKILSTCSMFEDEACKLALNVGLLESSDL